MQFTEESISVSFKEKEHEYTVYYRPIWSWACDLMKNAKIASKFHWDARRIYRYSDKTKSFMRFYDEPWTGDRFWEIQVNTIVDMHTKRAHSMICIVQLEGSERTAVLFYNVCRQEQAVIIWFTERLSRCNAVRKHTHIYA